jgi:hypothetical protein
VVENVSLVISLSATDIVTKIYSLDLRFGGVLVLNTVGFDVLRGNGSMESYIVGNRDGVHVPSILGPIVGFYARRGLAIDALGAYVDPSLWPDRPSRLVMLRAGGRTYGHGNAYSFDHNMELGEPFVIRIAKVVIYYDSNKIRGMQVVYEDHLRHRTPISSGNTTSPSQSVTVVFELGDYIKVLDINGDFNSQISGACLAGMRLTVVRAAKGTEETITAGHMDFVIRSEGPIVAFHGLIQGASTCIARLGGHRLLHSSELPRVCLLPNLGGNAVLSSTLNKIVTDQIVNVSCQNPSLVAVSGATMRCREDGIWDRRELVCKEPYSTATEKITTDSILVLALSAATGFLGILSLTFIVVAVVVGVCVCVNRRKRRGVGEDYSPCPSEWPAEFKDAATKTPEVQKTNMDRVDTLLPNPTFDSLKKSELNVL